jgi:hypothetical protein
MMVRALLIALACTSAFAASAQDPSALKIGTYQARPGAVPRLFPGQDLCKLCQSPTATGKPAMCAVVLCRPLDAEALVTYRPIMVPPNVGKAARDCPINAICRQESFDFSGWPPKEQPGLPVYRQSEPYKLWLESARLGHEQQLRRGEITREAYRGFIADYRADWKGLAGR